MRNGNDGACKIFQILLQHLQGLNIKSLVGSSKNRRFGLPISTQQQQQAPPFPAAQIFHPPVLQFSRKQNRSSIWLAVITPCLVCISSAMSRITSITLLLGISSSLSWEKYPILPSPPDHLAAVRRHKAAKQLYQRAFPAAVFPTMPMRSRGNTI